MYDVVKGEMIQTKVIEKKLLEGKSKILDENKILKWNNYDAISMNKTNTSTGKKNKTIHWIQKNITEI